MLSNQPCPGEHVAHAHEAHRIVGLAEILNERPRCRAEAQISAASTHPESQAARSLSSRKFMFARQSLKLPGT